VTETIGSQVGQDVFVRGLLPHDNGFFVEAGAADGLTYSNTLLFARDGWKGLLVEPVPQLFIQCRENRPESFVSHAILDSLEKNVDFWIRDGYISGTVAFGTDYNPIKKRKKIRQAKARGHVVQRETYALDYLLDSIGAPKIIDYMSLDTEGSEYRILAKFPFSRYAFKVMTIERPKSQLLALLAREGYRPIKKFYLGELHLDTVFVHSELMKGVDP